jgi:hypothetical protein
MKPTSTKLTADDALALAKAFREASTALGDYLYANWAKISESNRNKLRSLEMTLLNLATDLATQAVGIALDEGQCNLKALTDATKEAKKALEKIESAKNAIKVATALIGLAAAIPTGNLESIYSAFNSVRFCKG